ncbi:prolyl oligopeptidase [Coccidioides immitis RS]|uniref:Dipeptidyl-peptidase V n=1 Tax=Coccidioides immitis (strain RS) TaxID=246410 RepID=A0A0D8JRS6_COCIM|nr:prolyl oligopeptidase [Coccidioides immitis RS]KJF60055.1 prolyl oligopeptidase [Coccidioides immitis RS]TPX25114.1 DEIH-box ATPase [Coccidioides immitis]
MTIRPAIFTPDVLLSAPRRSAAIPNASGTLVAYTQTKYSFDSHSSSSELRVLDVASRVSALITDDFKGEPQWLGDGDQLVWLRGRENGNTSIVIGSARNEKPYVAGVVPGPVDNLKITQLSPSEFGFAVSGKANPDGSLYNPSDVKAPFSSGKLYTSLFVRHWDEYISPQRNAIWLGVLQRLPVGNSSAFQSSGLVNLFLLAGLNNVESPIPPFGGTDHFDICNRGVVFISKDPKLNPATHTKCVCYYCPLSSWTNPMPLKARTINIPWLNGALASPVISPVNNTLAFLAMKMDGYEADKNRIILVRGLFDGSSDAVELFAGADGTGQWDRSPGSLTWAHDDSSLFMQVPDTGRQVVFQLPLNRSRLSSVDHLIKLTHSGSISKVVSRPCGLFLSSSSLVESSLYSIITFSDSVRTTVLSSSSKNGASFGLSESQIDEVWWKGARGRDVHGWIVKPSKFNPGEKYPLCFLVHGGPQSAWLDQWSTRWNPLVFAEQGYVVFTPNPTGSTSYGQAFTDDIRGSWGGHPYEDLVRGFEFIEQNLAYVDTSRAVALGASYGGFMMNWIQGHELGRKFKALVTHDGIFSTKFALATEELYFPIHDLKGTYWQSRDVWGRWDPSEFVPNWQTPHLVIHSALDYRLSIAEGLATFNALQMQGVESAFLTFPDENHWVLKPENSLVWHRTVINWINKYAGLAPWLDKNGSDGFPAEDEDQKLARGTTRISMT